MTFLQWDSSLASGHEIIDNQNKRLVHMLNTLHITMSTEVDQRKALHTLRQIITYSIFHFNEEEYCTSAVDFDLWQANRCEYINLIESFTLIVDQIHSDNTKVALTILHLASKLYIEHMLTLDKSIFTCLKSQTASMHLNTQDTL